MTLGDRIKARRKHLGLSVDELAARLGKNRATIYRYESDHIEMPASLLEPLAQALETTPDELMGWGDLIRAVREQDAKINDALPYMADGLSLAGSGKKCLLFKLPAKGSELEEELKAILITLYQLNHNRQQGKLRSLRVLAELVQAFDAKDQDKLLSYAEFLEADRQKHLGITVKHRYQPESASTGRSRRNWT